MAEKHDKDGSSPDRHPAVAIARRLSKLLDRGSISPKELKNDQYDGSVSIKTWRRKRPKKKS